MVIVTSRFRVANGMEEAVAIAFQNRPHLVDSAPGFLGIEVVRDVVDSTRFQLITRWANTDSYQRWHSSDAHRASHCAIPKGLRLDPAFTRVEVTEAFEPRLVQPRLDVLLRFVVDAVNIYWIKFDAEFRLVECNEAFARAMGNNRAALQWTPIDSLLAEGEGARLRSELKANGSVNSMLNFVDRRMAPFSVLARVAASGMEWALIAEPATEPISTVAQNMLLLQNELACLNRETAQKNRELAKASAKAERALRELEDSFWHLRKIQEVLPICMWCKKVKTADSKWEDVAEYLRKNSLFLSHGLCPECSKKWRKPPDATAGTSG